MSKKLFLLISLVLVVALVGTNVAFADVIEVRVAAGDDDAEERVDDGSVDLTSSDLEITEEGAPADNQLIGMRFNNIDIPQGAIITSAYVQFHVDETDVDSDNRPGTKFLRGEAVDNAATFSDADFDISSRPTTSAEASWDWPLWLTEHEEGPDQQTSDISAVIQELVDRPGWSPGNSLALIITGSGENTAEAFEGEADAAPLLHVEFSAASAALPQGWQSQDIGTTGGSAAESEGTWAISADGADIWGSADEFHYAYVSLSGDGTIVAQVISNGEGSNGWAKGGVMIRETLDQGSKHAIMALTGGEGGGIAFQCRPETDGSSWGLQGDVTASLPHWVKLTRIGNTITGYHSADGVAWELMTDTSPDGDMTDPIDIEMAADVYIGLFATSHASGEIRTYTFDNVSIELPRAMDNWEAAVAPAAPGFLATNIADGVYDIGAFSGDITYEFAVNSNPDEQEGSMCLIGRRNYGDTTVGLKYDQWQNTGTYGATIFGDVDLDYGIATNPGVDTHLVFVSSEAASTTALYVNGVYQASVDRAITLSGIVGIGYGASAEDGSESFDNFDGDIFGVAIYDTALSDEEIAAHSDAFFAPPDVTAPGDAIQGVPNDGLQDGSGNFGWPGAETPDLAIDDNTGTKFLHFKGELEPTGFQVTPSAGATIVTGLTFTTANDAAERDPIEFELSGSNESIDGPYELIASGDIVDFAQADAWPRFTMNATPILFDNDVAYAHYQVLFPAVRDAASANSMQIAEVELLGVPAPADPVGYWMLDDGEGAVAVDSSGNGNDGILIGTAMSWMPDDGMIGGALSFDGTASNIDYVEISTADISLAAGTIAMWGKLPPDPQLPATRYFVGHTTIPAWSDRIQLYMDNSDTILDLGLGDSHSRHQDIMSLTTETWYHVALTWDGGNYVVYVNGEEKANGSYTGLDTLNTIADIGNDGNPGDRTEAFNGLLDDVRIYDRTLSADELSGLAGVSGENLLPNPSFEEDEPILDDPDWVSWCTWNPAEGAGSNTTIVDTESIDGTRSLLVEPKGVENWHFILVNISFAANLDKNYTAGFWAKAEAPRPLTVQMKASDNSVDAWGATDFELTTEWAEYSYTSEVLHTDVKLEFLCSGTEVPFWLDLVTVYEAE